MAQTMRRLEPLLRQQGGTIPQWTNVADWCDALVLVANTAQSYATKVDAASVKGTKLRISASVGPVYMNSRGATATIPGATTTDGSSSVMIIPWAGGGVCTLVNPNPGGSLSFVCGAASVLTIEAFD